jgi:hypothetical protein
MTVTRKRPAGVSQAPGSAKRPRRRPQHGDEPRPVIWISRGRPARQGEQSQLHAPGLIHNHWP